MLAGNKPCGGAVADSFSFLALSLSQLEARIQGLSPIFTWAFQDLISTRKSSSEKATHSDLLQLSFHFLSPFAEAKGKTFLLRLFIFVYGISGSFL